MTSTPTNARSAAKGSDSGMDYEGDFLAAVASVTATLRSRGKEPRDLTYDGKTVRGWVLETTHHSEKTDIPPSSRSALDFHIEEYTENGYRVLAEDGTFWEVSRWHHEIGNGSGGSVDSGQRCQQLPLSFFVGTEGKPFEKWKAELERLPYK